MADLNNNGIEDELEELSAEEAFNLGLINADGSLVTPAVNTGDVIMGGLGLGGAAYAAQTGQPPAVTSTGGPPAVTSTSGPPATTSAGARPRSASDFDFRLNRATPSRLARFGGPGALIYGAADVRT